MTRAMEHCDDTAMEHCDDKGYETLRCQGSWSTVMNVIMDHCDDKNSGEL